MEHASQHTGPLWWFRHVMAWIVILGISAALIAAVLIPRIAGATPYAIATGSMRPGMPPGTLVVVKPVAIREIAIGDVVTYQLKSGEPTVVTHRVVGISTNGKGERTFRTQGDANPVADPKYVRPVQIKGERWYDIRYLGYANAFISRTERHLAMIAAVAGLLVYAGYMFASAFRARVSDRRVSS